MTEDLDFTEAARAEMYALLGNLFYQPPSKELLHVIATGSVICNDESVSDFCRAWRALQQAAAQTDAEKVNDEFDAAFIGTGRQPVMLYGSFYVAGFLHEKPLALLRQDLRELGIERRGDRHESEDHVSALCDVMRLLIAGDAETSPAALSVQREFFQRHIAPWQSGLNAAISAANQTNFYRNVAAVLSEFIAVENSAFEMS
ncbi:MAG: molecular chaperone [Betaproteobacteria bacterium]|nr:molecular chaperone [Betaproteobacteria bacterium]